MSADVETVEPEVPDNVAADSERDDADRYMLQKVVRVASAYEALRVAENVPIIESRRASLIVMERKNLELALENLKGAGSLLNDVLTSRGIVSGVRI